MPIHTIYTLAKDDAEARSWLAFFRRHGYPALAGLAIERVFWLEGDISVERLLPLLVNPLYQTAAKRSQLDPAQGPIVEIAYRPAVTDPETPSILAGARALGEDGLELARLSKRYQFAGLDETEARRLAARFLYNKVVERVREPGELVATLRPTGSPDPVGTVSLLGLSDDELDGLSRERSWYAPLSQMKAIQAHERAQGRPHTDAEIEILAQSWSDHCFHTTWKSLGLLKRLAAATARINHPLVVSSFKDNAGGIEFYEDWVVTIKGETHNFPSSIAPFGGVATKHGGVIRDTLGFGKGAYPIGGTTIMATLDPRLSDDEVPPGALHPQLIVSESIRATAYYCNPMGIPMMHPVYRAHPGYAKCLALGHSIGLIPRKHALKDAPRPGDLALLIGGETGRDGIHGATASSTGMTGETLEKESAAVQIGHPITERRFTSAIPVLRDAGCLRALTDLGAGGISCAVGEMGAETGVAISLDAVPLKDQSLTAWEILLSESQERMLLVVSPEKLAEARSILDRYEVGATVLGKFTASRRFEATWKGRKAVDLELEFLWHGCPLDAIDTAEPQRRLRPLEIPEPQTPEDWSRSFHGVLSHYHCADQSAAGSRFDTTVQGRTAIGPYSGKNHRMPTNLYVSAPLYGKSCGVVTTVAVNPFYGEIDPAQMARLMIVEALTKAVVAGVDYRDCVLCDNFYTPRVRPEIAWDLKRMVETVADFSEAIGVPFISGKDSSSGTFEAPGPAGQPPRRIDVPPTLAVAVLGRVPDTRKIVTKEFKRAGNKLLVVGAMDPATPEAPALAGSVYADVHGQRGDRLFDPGDAVSIRSVWDALLSLHRGAIYVSGSAIAEGGIALRLFEAAYGSGLGAHVDAARADVAWASHSLRSGQASPAVAGASRSYPSSSISRRVRGQACPERSERDARTTAAGTAALLFGEFIGAALIEVAPEVDVEESLGGVRHCVLGEVTPEPQLALADSGDMLWREAVSSLTESWSRTFREVLE
ncbi:MAG TPA: AIR synthase-related protein [Terriglobia bacterium]|nr:AIR synthase-related protein [Terriglobia bacterium]